jgi:hypothetical protein
MRLKRRQIEDDLNERIFIRPGPLELVEKNILQEGELTEVIRSGQVSYRKTSDTPQRRRSSILNPLEQLALDAAELADYTTKPISVPVPEEDYQLSSDDDGMDDNMNLEREPEQKQDSFQSVRRKGVTQPPVLSSLLTPDGITRGGDIGDGHSQQQRVSFQQNNETDMFSQLNPSHIGNLTSHGVKDEQSVGFHNSTSHLSNSNSTLSGPIMNDGKGQELRELAMPGYFDIRSPDLTSLPSPGLSDLMSMSQGVPGSDMGSSDVESVRSPLMSASSSRDISNPPTPVTPLTSETSDMTAQEPMMSTREEAMKKKDSYRGGKASPRQPKRRRPKKPTQWKIHFYNPPNQSSASFSQQKPVISVPNSPYQILIQQQQIYLQLQLMCQQMQAAAAAAAANSNIVNTTNNPPPKTTSKLINQPNNVIPVAPANNFTSIPLPPPAPPLPDIQIAMAPGAQVQVPSTVVNTSGNGMASQPVVAQNCMDPGKALESFTMSMLKEELKKRGLPVSGNKQQLISRLRPYADVVALAPGMKPRIQPVQPTGLDLTVGSRNTTFSQQWRERASSLSSISHRSSSTMDNYSVTSPLEEMRQLEQAVSSGWSGHDMNVSKPQEIRRGSVPASLEIYSQPEPEIPPSNQQVQVSPNQSVQFVTNQLGAPASQPLSHPPLNDDQQTVTQGLYMSGSPSSSMEGLSSESLPGAGMQDASDNGRAMPSRPGPLTFLSNGLVTQRPKSPVLSPIQSSKPLRRYVVEVEGLKQEMNRHSKLIDSPYGTPPSSNMFEVDSNQGSSPNSCQHSPLALSPMGQPDGFPPMVGSGPVQIPVTGDYGVQQLQGIVYGSPIQGSPFGSNSIMISQAAINSSPSEAFAYSGLSPLGDLVQDQQYFPGMSSRESSPTGYYSQMLGLEPSPNNRQQFQGSGPSIVSGRSRASSLSMPRRMPFQLQGGQTPGQQHSPLMDSSSEPNLFDLDPNLVLGGNFPASSMSGTRTGLDWLDPASPVGNNILPSFNNIDNGLGNQSGGGSLGGSNPSLQETFQFGPVQGDMLGHVADNPMFEFDPGDPDLQYQQQTDLRHLHKFQHLPPDYVQSTSGQQLPLGHLGNSWQG